MTFEISAHLATDSSTSLAGSILPPSNKPYCVHDTLQEENESDFQEKEHSTVDYTLLDSDKMSPCKSTEFIEDYVTCAEDSEVSIEEDMMNLKEMTEIKCTYEIDENYEIIDVIEADVEDYHIFESKQTVKIGQEEDDDETIARVSIIESDQNIADDLIITEDQYIDGVENEDAYDSVVEDDIKLDVDNVINEGGILDDSENIYIILEVDKKSLNDIRSEDMILQEQKLKTGKASVDKKEIDSITKGENEQYIGSLLEIKKDLEDIMVESNIENNVAPQVVSYDNEDVDGVESVEKDANHVIEKDLSQTHNSPKSIDGKSYVHINPDLSQQYIHVDELNESENVKLEKSTVPKTPFHSLTNFGEDDEDDEVPE